MWIAGVVPAWRVVDPISDIIALDDKRALAISSGKIAEVDLATGAVTLHDVSFAPGAAGQIVRAGGKLIAFGHIGKLSGAWTVDPSTFAVTPIELPDPSVGVGPKGRFLITVSPDGKQVFTCSDDRWPTLRDATTLAPVKVFTGVDACNSPRFVDAGHVVIDRSDGKTAPRSLDLASGKATAVKIGGPVVALGPGGRSASTLAGTIILDGPDGKQVATYTARLTVPQWLADGSAYVGTVKGKLTVLPATAGQTSREIDLPAQARRIVPVPGTTRVVMLFGMHRLGVLDTTTGKLLTAANANLVEVEHIAALDGTVISGAERVRVWRGDTITATSPLAVVENFDVEPGKSIMYATLDGVFSLDARTGEMSPFDDEANSSAMDRHGDRIAYDKDDRVMMYVDKGPTKAWFKRTDDFFVTDIDVATGRIAMNDDNAFYIVRPDENELFGFHSFDCDDPLYLWLERGRERAVSYDGVTVHLYDTEQEKGLGGVELVDDNIEAVTFIPGSDELALVGESIYLWNPKTKDLVAWPLPAEMGAIGASAIGADPAGKELAVGFDDGAVLWVRLADLRTRATAVGADVATMQGPAKIRCTKPMVKNIEGVRSTTMDEDEEPSEDEYED